MRYECSQPAVLFRQRDLPVVGTRIECTDKLSFADAAQHFVDGWHRARITDSKRVQIAIVTCDADTAIFLCVRGEEVRDLVILSTQG